jgi:hypothetical protein
MPDVRIVDVTDDASFVLVPPCADPGFDHRSCDYWEDAERGSKAARSAWLEAPTPPANPFRVDSAAAFNPFAPVSTAATSVPASNPFAGGDDDPLADNPFAPRRPARPQVGRDAPRKLALLGRGLAIFGSYGGLHPVRPAVRLSARAAPARAVPAAAAIAAAGSHHVHRNDRRGSWRRPCSSPGRSGLR